MRDSRELSVGPEPLPSGLRLLPPQLPPAPPGTGAPSPSDSPRLRLVGLLLPCYEDVVTFGRLLNLAEAKSGNQDDLLTVHLTEIRARLLARLRRFNGLARADDGLDEETLRIFQHQLLTYAAGGVTVDPLTVGSRRAIQRSLLIGAEEAGFKPQELGTDEPWTYPLRGLNTVLPPRMFLLQTVLQLNNAVNDASVSPDVRRFERVLFHPMATVLLAALEVVSLGA